MCRKRLDTFPGWNRCTAFHSCNDHTLGNIRKCIFKIQSTGCPTERTDTRTVIIGNAFFIQNVHLLSDRAIDTRISGMKPYCHFALCFSTFHNCNNFFKCHFCTVMNCADIFAVFQKLRIYQRSCINNHICLFQILFSSYCDKIR